jgi:hypothetical protein
MGLSFAEVKELARSFWWLGILILPLLLAGYHFRSRLSAAGRGAWMAISSGLVIALIGLALLLVWHNYREPPQWDFQLYWVFGRAAKLGVNPYDTAALREIAASVPVSDELMQETFFLHSSPTLLVFAPLGWLDLHTACLVWQLVHLVFLFAAIGLMWRMFGQTDDAYDVRWLLVVALLTLGLRATLETIRFTQVNFLLLTLLLGVWHFRERWQAGVLLGLALVVKPVFFLLPLYFLVRGRWSALSALAATGVATCGVSIVAFGSNMFFDYFRANPVVQSIPSYFYTEWINQSLLATSLRLTDWNLDLHSPYANPLFLAGAGVLLTISGWLAWRLPRSADDWALAITLALTLLLFPKTLSHYVVLLVPAILLVWTNRQRVPGGIWFVVTLLGTVYLLVGAQQAFAGMILVWLSLAFVGGHILWNERAELSQIETT